MAKCQHSTRSSRGGVNCRNPAAPGSRFCAQHTGGAAARRPRRPRRGGGRGRSRTRHSSNDGCGLFVLGFVLAVGAVVVGLMV
ncbi:hypothetical protein [Yinghuangia soli]|uniref:Uncharacterized protein n=1 Tax=Yinghuangia soli TaxID=2908204 RepID=A0AA41QA81_9ACTN|nr:hypothetical protein [Yinghuangia soli]MCF2533229.1 hypothetical protein [Yinghuangia soli]